jgi:hypothetical protein
VGVADGQPLAADSIAVAGKLIDAGRGQETESVIDAKSLR